MHPDRRDVFRDDVMKYADGTDWQLVSHGGELQPSQLRPYHRPSDDAGLGVNGADVALMPTADADSATVRDS